MRAFRLYRIGIGLIVFLVIGCGGSKPKTDEKPLTVYSLDKGLELLAGEIKQVVRSGIESGSIQAVLDIAVLDVLEKTTRKNLDFSSYLSSKLINLTVDLTKDKDSGIAFINTQKVRNAQKRLLKGAEPDYKKLGAELNSSMMFKGFFFQNNEETVTIQIEIFDPKTGYLHNTIEVAVAFKDVPKPMQKSFPMMVNKQFEALYQQTSEIEVGQIPAAVNAAWNEHFTEDHRQSLKNNITSSIYADIEGLVTEDDLARERLGTIAKINKEKEHISIYLRGKFVVQVLGYTYDLTGEQNNKVKQALNYINRMESILKKGFKISIGFIAKTDDNDPLDFECDGDRELELSIGSAKFNYEQATCNEEGQRQVMTWLAPFHMTAKNWSLVVIEDNIFGDEEVNAHVLVTKDNLLNVFYKGMDEIALTGSEYYLLRLTKHN